MDSLGQLKSVFARNCIVRRIGKTAAGGFLCANHRLGDATCRYRYGLFTRRSTGAAEGKGFPEDTLVAVATFSNGRTMRDGSRSYEWIRYASLPGTRVIGGMGKLLDAFVADIRPDDVMSYADRRWSDGAAYRRLGFTLEAVVEKAGFSNLKYRKKFNAPTAEYTQDA